MEIKRRLKKVEANFISLVGKGANNKIIIFKAEHNPGGLQYQKQVEIKKVDQDQRMVYGIVYSPDEVDLQGDLASAEVIKEMAYSFMKNARTNNVDQQHNFISDEGFVAESWLTKQGDPVFPLEKEGSWAVGIKVEKEETWQLVKSGEITGLSFAGLAAVEEVTKSNVKGEMLDVKRETSDVKGETSGNFMERFKKYFSSKSVIVKDLAKLKSAFGEIQELINQAGSYQHESNDAEENQSNIQKNNNAGNSGWNGENEMTPGELKKALEEGIMPLNEKLEALEKVNKDLTSRLEAVEKSTPGSRQVIKKEQGRENKIPIWT